MYILCRMFLYIALVLLLNYAKNGDFAAFKPNLESIFNPSQMNAAVMILEKHGIDKNMIAKFSQATTDAEKITAEFIADELKSMAAHPPMDTEDRKELADKMLDGVRMWFVALEIGIPGVSKFGQLAKMYNKSNLQLSLTINYFLRTTETVDNKIFNTIMDTMRQNGLGGAGSGRTYDLAFVEKNKLAHELLELVLDKSDADGVNVDRMIWM